MFNARSAAKIPFKPAHKALDSPTAAEGVSSDREADAIPLDDINLTSDAQFAQMRAELDALKAREAQRELEYEAECADKQSHWAMHGHVLDPRQGKCFRCSARAAKFDPCPGYPERTEEVLNERQKAKKAKKEENEAKFGNKASWQKRA